MKIKVGILISYDYAFAPRCIECVYKHADRIVLAVEKNNYTWNGGKIEIPDSFFKQIEAIDCDNKIEIYRDSFYDPQLSTMGNDTRERSMLGQYMGPDDGWHIQVDSDEYFVDFEGFVEYLHWSESKIKGRKVAVWANWITLFKQDQTGSFIVESKLGDNVPIATNYPYYSTSREVTLPSVLQIKCKDAVIHQSWAREEQEILQKLTNWSHNNDFDTHEYFQFWKSLNKYNAPYIHNFHPLPSIKDAWSSIAYVHGNTDELLKNYMANIDRKSTFELNSKLFRKSMLEKSFLGYIMKVYNKIFRLIFKR